MKDLENLEVLLTPENAKRLHELGEFFEHRDLVNIDFHVYLFSSIEAAILGLDLEKDEECLVTLRKTYANDMVYSTYTKTRRLFGSFNSRATYVPEFLDLHSFTRKIMKKYGIAPVITDLNI